MGTVAQLQPYSSLLLVPFKIFVPSVRTIPAIPLISSSVFTALHHHSCRSPKHMLLSLSKHAYDCTTITAGVLRK